MNKLTVSLSPHAKAPIDTQKVMLAVILALMPSFIASLYFFGVRAFIVTAVSVVAAVLTEYLITTILLKRKNTTSDLSAVVAGLLLAYNVPSSIPLWQIASGAVFAMGIAKLAFGGLGNNPFNPALAGRAFMLVSFPQQMTTWPQPVVTKMMLNPDALTAATPLGILKEHIKAGETIQQFSNKLPDYWHMFIGNIGGSLGETSALAILIGGLFLLLIRVISWRIPFFYLAGLVSITGIFYLIDPTRYADPLFHLLAGGVLLGAFFMATDLVTSPMSPAGQIIYALGGGILAALIRLFGSYPEGCSYSILIMNAFVPLIDRALPPSRFGKEASRA
ncbi:RnfABCDGE type electron transport complex subunit D [Spirochaetia bacterium 38H-sp]|uniref:Ion-translocating oxidoreductase complex subunit D n=1 Tax=Rarispira pelagica TaxID=3141764 RepID=A0ABU9UF72_9SPIR